MPWPQTLGVRGGAWLLLPAERPRGEARIPGGGRLGANPAPTDILAGHAPDGHRLDLGGCADHLRVLHLADHHAQVRETLIVNIADPHDLVGGVAQHLNSAQANACWQGRRGLERKADQGLGLLKRGHGLVGQGRMKAKGLTKACPEGTMPPGDDHAQCLI